MTAANMELCLRYVLQGLVVATLALPAPLRAQDERAAADFFEQNEHWAFKSLSDPPPPSVQRTDWVQNPVDRFILTRLEQNGLSPSAAADKQTLLRRATFDLTGLPPTPHEVESFLSDNAPDAFAKVVDRLLASPRYGERWARHWLDLVRYTDEFDLTWRYRDWVVDAFNRDLPYDQFVQLQIAGDRIAPDGGQSVNADGIVATTMLAIGQWGGLDRPKRLSDIVDDQIDVVGRGFLGLTLACARCHDHKFDPITTRDYYGLAGIFYSSRVFSDTAYLSHGTFRLRIPLVPAEDVGRHDDHQQRVAEAQARLDRAFETHYATAARDFLAKLGDYFLAAWDFSHPQSAEPAPLASTEGNSAPATIEHFAARRGLDPRILAQCNDYLNGPRMADARLLHVPIRDYDGEPGVHAWGASAERPWWGVNTNDHAVPIETFLLPPRSVSMNPGTDGGAVGWKSPISGTVRVSGRLADADPHDGVSVDWAVDLASEGTRWEVCSGTLTNAHPQELAQGRNGDRLSSIEVRPGDVLYLQVWLHVGDAHYDITTVELRIESLDSGETWDLTSDLLADPLSGNPHSDGLGNAAVWEFRDMAGSNRPRRMPAVDPLLQAWDRAVADVAAGAADRGTIERAARELQQAIDTAAPAGPLEADLTSVRSPLRFPSGDDTRLSSAAQAELAQRRSELAALEASTPPLPLALGVQEEGMQFGLFPGIGDARIHVRGNYEQLGPTVPRGFPHVLAGDEPLVIPSGSGRLELARWVASDKQPLTARVLVNRVWQHHFGEGIVRTPSNFGHRGDPPTHPELLDHLSTRFIESGWSLKNLHRLIMLSATWQQSSSPSPEAVRIDPENRLFSRMNRRRLEAETIRDSLLAICGRLDGTLRGPAEADQSSNRRMLYLATSRKEKSGFGALFDMADPSIHVERRTVSTVAPQALFLMNDSFVEELARRLLDRSEISAEPDPRLRINSMYRLIYARVPSDDEIAAGLDLLAALASEPLAETTSSSQAAPHATPWEAYVQALLLCNEILYVD